VSVTVLNDTETIKEATTTTTTITATTTTTITMTTTLPLKALNASCARDSECASRCCAYLGEKHICAPPIECRPKTVSEEECYGKQMNWCAGTCQKNVCGNCTKYMRCINRTDESGRQQAAVERAKDNPERPGSCIYSGIYENASGEDGYCGQNKGIMIYAKCGLPPEARDCAYAYGTSPAYTYRIMQQRAFHGAGGEDYDLWCFMCERAG